jgi:DNA-binding CsgD family transcriptional regulator
MALSEPIVCPVLVGRDEHRRTLHALWTKAADGAGQVALVSGEAGVGKSRLLREFGLDCAQRGALVIQGNCFESDRNLPYAAATDLVRRHLQGLAGDERADALQGADPQLARILPELFTRPPAAMASAEQERQQIGRALAELLTRLVAGRPAVLLVEDIHSGDEPSLDFLLGFARRIRARPFLLILSYRSDEVVDQLAGFLAELDRERLAVELGLRPLTPAEVEEMIRAIPGRPALAPSQDLYALTEGNPFFIEEVLRSSQSSGADGGAIPTPRTVREAVRRRSAVLSPEARRLAHVASVAGRQFDFAVLREVASLPEESVLASIRELMGAQLVVEESAERFGFRHALTREAIYTELLARERQALHGAVARVIEADAGAGVPAHAADLGYHFFEARDWPKALEYCAVAGEMADRTWAPRAAIEHCSRAVVAAKELGLAPSVALLLIRARGYEAVGEFERSRQDREAALATARSGADHQREWEALVDLGSLWASRDYHRTGNLYQEALHLAARAGDERLLAHSLNRVGNWHTNAEEPDSSLDCHRRALAIFERLGDQHGVAATLDLLGIASFLGCDLVAGLDAYRQAITLLRTLDDRAALISSLAVMALYGRSIHQTQTLVPCDLSPGEALVCSDEALALARESGLRSAESFVLWNRSDLLASQGRYREALDAAGQGLAIAERIDHGQWIVAATCFLGTIHRDIFALDQSLAHLERSARLAVETGSLHWMRTSNAELALTLTASGQHYEAERILATVLGDETPARTVAERLCWLARAELALARGDFSAAHAAVQRLAAQVLHRDDGPPGVGLSRLRGQALAGLGQLDEAESVLREGCDNAEAEGSLGELWRLSACLGRVLQARGDHASAAREFARARAVVEDLAVNLPDGLRESFLRGARATMPPAPPQRTGPGALTARETEVASLVAEGLSNRAIADRLVLGERTIETHVSSILGKLRFNSRAQVAAWMARQHRDGNRTQSS